MDNKTDWKDGIPPVGIECEYRNSDACNWRVITIAGKYDGYVWVQFKGEKAMWTLSGDGQFRPIKTQADKEREEVIAAGIKVCGLGDSSYESVVGYTVRDMINAGYRKQGEVVNANHVLRQSAGLSLQGRARWIEDRFTITRKTKNK